MPSLAEFLMSAQSEDDEDRPRPLHSAQIMELNEALKSYVKFLGGCPFRQGDIVTPIKGRSVKGAGDPHIVLEVVKGMQPDFTGSEGSSADGRRFDMRIACIVPSGVLAMFWVESCEFEPYDPDVHDK